MCIIEKAIPSQSGQLRNCAMFSELDQNTQTRLFNIVTQWGSFLSLTHKRADQLLDQVESRMDILIANHPSDTRAILSAWRCLSNQLLDIKEDATDDYHRNTSALGDLIHFGEAMGNNVRELKLLALTWTKQYDVMITELDDRFQELKNQKDLVWEQKQSAFQSFETPRKNRQIRPTRPLHTQRHLSISADAQMHGET